MCGRKRNNSIKLCLLNVVGVVTIAGYAMQMERIDGIPWYFTVSNNEAVLIGSLKGEVGDIKIIKEKLEIPEKLAGVKVAAIRDDVFVRSLFWHGTTRDSVRYVKVPAGISRIGPKCFSYFSRLLQIDVDPDNKEYVSENGILYRRDNKIVVCVPHGRLTVESHDGVLLRWPENFMGVAVIPEDVNRIADRAFFGCRNVTNIVFPKHISSIGDYAFSRCQGLIEIVSRS